MNSFTIMAGAPRSRVARLLLGVVMVWAAAACSNGPESEGANRALADEAEAVEDPGTVSANLPLSTAPQTADDQTPATATQSLNQSRSTALVRAAERVAPAVVSVNVLRRQTVRARTAFDALFLGPSRSRESVSYGSGILVRPPGHSPARGEGLILTNDHVVRGAQEIRVTLSDGRDLEAELVGTDGVTDVAVLRVDADELPVAPLGTSQGLLIGEWAMAIGNPFAYLLSNTEPTVTAGVITAVGRHIIPSDEDQGFYLGMIQTDASINPGNSGGPLVNSLGDVIGVNTSIFSRSGGSEGLGFAIPIDRALRVAEDLIQYGEVRRAWTGLDVRAADADRWGRSTGVEVESVAPGSPGDEAGLRPGDRLVAANGRSLGSYLDLEAVLLDAKAGDGIDIAVQGRRRALTLTTETLPTSRAHRVEILNDLEVVTVTPEIQAEQGLAPEPGALITGIAPAVSGTLGLERGDVILQINNQRIRSAEDAAEALRSLRSGMMVRIYFRRDWAVRALDFRAR
jgi:serine protease Do